MSTFSLAVLAAPDSSAASFSAYKFAQALTQQDHKLLRVFFYHDGVHNASALISPPQDELNLNQAWQDLAQEHQVDLVVCIAAALRRGVINEEEAQRYNKNAANLSSGFTLSGLGQLVEAAIISDRLVTFGG